jgi:hypothetical protein
MTTTKRKRTPLTPTHSSVRTATGRRNRKLKSPDEAARNIIHPVSSTIDSRSERKKGNHERTKLRRLLKRKYKLITVDNINKNSDAYKRFGGIISGVTSDLGGEDRLPTMEHSLI